MHAIWAFQDTQACAEVTSQRVFEAIASVGIQGPHSAQMSREQTAVNKVGDGTAPRTGRTEVPVAVLVARTKKRDEMLGKSRYVSYPKPIIPRIPVFSLLTTTVKRET